ncbi:hypothetical protein E1281_10295 [Actinomadura sp. KC345]|uniref:hypothetical protein n=1 Tax=Actinomadura sp. KC345 TaxID=2530371 RepID=UPI001043443C|nr:hypothetical protein [Actinomadura sp. KC345]TDC55837.1 hypothetical protein E1281_10295 [Actinomadura sp. KC345]
MTPAPAPRGCPIAGRLVQANRGFLDHAATRPAGGAGLRRPAGIRCGLRRPGGTGCTPGRDPG